MRSSVRVGIAQLALQAGAHDENLARALEAVEALADQGCRLACLPEAFATTVDLRGLRRIAEPFPGKTIDALAGQARRLGIHVVAGVIEADGDRFYSSAVLLDAKGEVAGRYRRIHVHRLERGFLTGGAARSVVHETALGRIGLVLGYDLNFPETCRSLFAQRVEVIVCPAQIPIAFGASTERLAVARAIENCCYVVLASSAGENVLARFRNMGGSLIARDPTALDDFSLEYVPAEEIVAKAGAEEQLVVGDLDLRRIRREQKENSHYGDARFGTASLEGYTAC